MHRNSREEMLDRINNDFKKRKQSYLFITIITILLLLPYASFWFDSTKVKQVFHIGFFHTEKDYLQDYRDSYAGIHLELDIIRRGFKDSQVGVIMYGYMVYTSVSIIASENIETIGFSSRLQLHLRDKKTIEHNSDKYNPPIRSLFFSTGYMMNKGVVCNSTGKVTYHFLLNSNQYNQTTEYFIDFIIPYSNLDYEHFNLMIYTILCLYILLIGLIPLIFYKIIKPTFRIKFDMDDLEREIKFRRYMNNKKR